MLERCTIDIGPAVDLEMQGLDKMTLVGSELNAQEVKRLERTQEGKVGGCQWDVARFLVDLTAGGKDGGVDFSFEVDRHSVLARLLKDEMVDLFPQFTSQLQEGEDALANKG